MDTRNFVLRTIYLDPDLDDQLRQEALQTRTNLTILFNSYLKLGMQIARERPEAAVPDNMKPPAMRAARTRTTQA